MFFPYKDDNPRILIPYVTYSIIIINALVFLYQLSLDYISQQEFILSFGLIPATFTDTPLNSIVSEYSYQISTILKRSITLDAVPGNPFLTTFTSMFMHGSLMHIIGNMWFLWIFGDNVESTFGHARFGIFYLLCGIGAAFTQIFIDVSSMIPMVGASGAIAGVLGAYMLRFPRARVHVFIFLFIIITTIQIPAFIVIGIWFFTQISSGLGALGSGQSAGIAWFAHIGGFIAGVIFERIFKFIRIAKY
jgi:membrane associated rhomboid family serine protease